MPTFIDMSALTKRTTLTGNEEFQVSATEKVTAQQIADLASTGIQTVTVTNFKTNIWNDDSGSNVFRSVPVGGMVVFKSAVDATSGPGEALIGYAIKSSSLMASYVGMTRSNEVSMIPTLYTNKSSSIYDTKWQKLPDDSNVITPIEVTDFSLIGESLPANLTPGMIIPFYTGSEVYSYPGAETKYTGFIQLGTEYAASQFASVFAIGYAAGDYATGNVYVGQLDITAQNIDWTKNKMAPAVVSAFTESVFSNLFYVGTAGEFIAFSAPNATKNTNNQYPGNGAWHGIACQGYGGYTHIIAFNSNSAGSTGEAYIGLCIGSTTQWTALGGGGSAEPQIAQVNGFGEIYDNNPWLKDLPKGSIVPFETTSHGGASDMGPWGNFANHITGYIHVTLGPEGEEDRGAYIYAFLDTSTVSTAAGQGCCAYAYIQSSDGGETGGVAQESEWYRVGDLPIAEFTTDSPIQINGSLKVGDVVKMRLKITQSDTAGLILGFDGTVDVSFQVENNSGGSGVLLTMLRVNKANLTGQNIDQITIPYGYTISASLGTTTLTIYSDSFAPSTISSDYIYLERH